VKSESQEFKESVGSEQLDAKTGHQAIEQQK